MSIIVKMATDEWVNVRHAGSQGIRKHSKYCHCLIMYITDFSLQCFIHFKF